MSVRYVTEREDFRQDEEIRAEGKKPVMCYRTKTITSGEVREVECYPVIVCSREERRRLRQKSKEQIRQANQRNRVKTLQRKINVNFTEGDHVITLTNDSPVTEGEMRRRLHNFLAAMRRIAKKAGAALKYIYVLEWTKVNGVVNYHVHMVMNRFCDRETVEGKWQHGFTECKGLKRREGTFNSLARYMVDKNRNRVAETGGKAFVCSVGLKEPEVRVSDKKMTRGRVNRLIRAVSNEEQREIIEKKNPGWRCVEIETHFSDIFDGAYVYAIMVKNE